MRAPQRTIDTGRALFSTTTINFFPLLALDAKNHNGHGLGRAKNRRTRSVLFASGICGAL